MNKKVRSNSKEVREAIKKHLLEIIQTRDNSEEVKTPEQASKFIAQTFYDEMIKGVNPRNIKNYQEAFIYWLQGLALSTLYTTYDIIEFLHSLGLYGKDAEQEEQSERMYYYLIYKEVKNEFLKLI